MMSEVKSEIRAYIDGHTQGWESIDQLPLMYANDWDCAYKTIKEDTLYKTNHTEFTFKMITFFYGKPFSQVSKTNLHGNEMHCPVCFIIPVDKVKVNMVYPFDLTNFKDTYKKYIHDTMEITNFEIGDTKEDILKYIKAFYDNNANYLDGKQKKLNDINNPYVGILDRIHSDNEVLSVGQGAHIVNVFSQSDIEDIKRSVECIILPNAVLRYTDVKNYLNDNKICYISYKIRPGKTPYEYNTDVMYKALEYIEKKGKGHV